MKIPLPQSSNHDSVLPTLCQSVIWKIHAILPLKSSVGKKSHFENIQLCPSHSMKTFISSSTFISPFFMIFSIVGLCFLDDCLFVCLFSCNDSNGTLRTTPHKKHHSTIRTPITVSMMITIKVTLEG